jgi:DNA-binding transcriptional ArsR family regulator
MFVKQIFLLTLSFCRKSGLPISVHSDRRKSACLSQSTLFCGQVRCCLSLAVDRRREIVAMSSPTWISELNGLLERSGYQDNLEARADDAKARLAELDLSPAERREPDHDLAHLQNQVVELVLRLGARSPVRAPSMNTRILAEALPTSLKTRLDFKPAPCAVAVVLARMAYPVRYAKVTVAAIVQASHLTRRSVQRALRALEVAGLINSHATKVRRDFNEPNLYYLGDAFAEWFERPASASKPSRKRGDSNDARLTPKINNQITTFYKQDVSNAPDGEQPQVSGESLVGPSVGLVGRGSADGPLEALALGPAPVECASPSDAPSDWEGLAVRAVKALDPDAKDASPWLALDRLRRERLIGFNPRFWQAAASRHAHRALLAVAEVLLRPAEYFRVGPLAYLAGVLRKPQLECAPERSVARILAERSGSAFPSGAPALPIGVKPVEAIDPPDEPARRRIFDAVGAAAYRAWFEDSVVFVTEKSVLAKLTSQWRVDWVQRNYGSVLRRAQIGLELREAG